MIRAVMRSVRKPCVLSVALLALVPRGEAQVISGTVEGRVTDSSGAVLPGVTITALNTATAATFAVTTTSEGLYRVPYVPAGIYDVRADLSGFRTETKEGVTVRGNDSAVVDFTLTVA